MSPVHHVAYLASTNVSVTDGKTVKVFGLSIEVNDLWSAVLAAILVCGLGLRMARRATPGVPSKPQLIWEMIVGYFDGQLQASERGVLPLAVTYFTFILACNWFELFFWTGHTTAWLPTPTSNVNIDYMMALIVFVVTNAVALRGGLRNYLRRFVRPYKVLLPLNIIEELIKPVTLSLRLFGNVFSGALIFALSAGLFAHFQPPIVVVGLIWLPFDLAIFFIQAFIFALLTVIYYQQAVAVSQGAAH